MNLVDCREVTKKFGRVKAVDEFSFQLSANKILGLIGRNGAGKTTLLKMIAGHFLPNKGELKVFDMHPFNNLQVAANMIFVDDYLHIPQSMYLEEIIEVMPRFYENWNSGLAKGLVDYFDLPLKQNYQKLSTGMKSTFNSILGISARCPLTVLDEPTLGMDAAVRQDIYRALLKDFMDYPRTIILSSHLLNEVEHILEEVLLMDEGRRILHLPIDELKECLIGLQGSEQEIDKWVELHESYHMKRIGKDQIYVVIPNKFLPDELGKLRSHGVEVSYISPADICVYLTAKDKGGVDRVFEQT